MNVGLKTFPGSRQRPQFIDSNGGWLNGATTIARPPRAQPGDLLIWQQNQGHDQSGGNTRYNWQPGLWTGISGTNYRSGPQVAHFIENGETPTLSLSDSGQLGMSELITAWRGVRAIKHGPAVWFQGASITLTPPVVDEDGVLLVALLAAGINASISPSHWSASRPEWKFQAMAQRWYPSQHCWAAAPLALGPQPPVTFTASPFTNHHHCTLLALLPKVD